jgi:hypothetical protein
MTDEILDRPITYLVKVSRSKIETAIIPVVAMDPEEAKRIAKSKIGENCHEWRPSGSEETMHGVIGTRGMANDWQTSQYRKGADQ